MAKKIRLVDDQLVLHDDEWPLGATAHSIVGPDAEGFRRMVVFGTDLVSARDWLNALSQAGVEQAPTHIDQALYEAALVGFCRCFDSTAGLRARPLNPRRIFSPEQRQQFETMRTMRNRVVAHDEQLASATIAMVIKNAHHVAIEAVATNLSVSFSGFSDSRFLRPLIDTALGWVEHERDRLARVIVDAFNALPLEVRAAAPAFTFQIVQGQSPIGSSFPSKPKRR